MNTLDTLTLNRANQAAIYNLYLYLAQKTTPAHRESFHSIVSGLENTFVNRKPYAWSRRDIYRLGILKNAIKIDPVLAESEIGDLTRSENGMNACTFRTPSNEVFVVFKGTGGGEWIDNGEGLSGIPEENTYITYGEKGRVLSTKIEQNDYATDQQVQALNWFNYIASKKEWNSDTHITVSGHSKGGNKAQFIAINSDLVDACYSFDGQGFSPESLTALKDRYGSEFDIRSRKLYSFSGDNDYVNILGERLISQDRIYYFESFAGFHYLEAILDGNGNFNPQTEQGRLSRYIQNVSKELMKMPPGVRQYATLGVMNILQKYLGKQTPVNGDEVSIEKTIAGIAVALGMFWKGV